MAGHSPENENNPTGTETTSVPVEIDEVIKPDLAAVGGGAGKRFVLDIPAHREHIRGRIALLLLALLAGEVLIGLVAIWWSTPEVAKHVMDWLHLVLPPTIALFGAATGFYYGTKSE